MNFCTISLRLVKMYLNFVCLDKNGNFSPQELFPTALWGYQGNTTLQLHFQQLQLKEWWLCLGDSLKCFKYKCRQHVVVWHSAKHKLVNIFEVEADQFTA